MVFQSYALWPHMTVRKNVAYPLRARQIKGEQAAEWVEEVAGSSTRRNLLDRYPGQLSGGQQQRVALARASSHARRPLRRAAQQPRRAAARARAQRDPRAPARLGITAVYVTHDQARRSRSATAWRSCGAARSSSSARPRRSSRSPRPTTSPTSSAWRTAWLRASRARAGRTKASRSTATWPSPARADAVARTRAEDIHLAPRERGRVAGDGHLPAAGSPPSSAAAISTSSS